MMWKNIAVDYYRAYSWSGIRETWKTNAGALVSIIYPLFVMLFQMTSGEKCAYLIVYLPMLYILLSVHMHPVRLCKMMYLCPMEADRRMQYIRSSYNFGIAMRMTSAFIGTGILVMLYDCGMIVAAKILLNDLVLSLLLPSEKKTDDRDGVFHKEIVCMIFMIAVPMLCNLILALAIADGEPHRTLDRIIFACIVLIQAPLVFRYRKYVHSELEKAVYYEEKTAQKKTRRF